MDKYRLVTPFQSRVLDPVVRPLLERGWPVPATSCCPERVSGS